MTKSYIKLIKARDKFKCQNPECDNKNKRIHLSICCIDDNVKDPEPWNLITLCTKCKTRLKYEGYLKLILTDILKKKYKNNWKK